MKAVILAAGVGERLKPLINSIPKALIKIEDKTLIEYSLDNLQKAGIKEVIIVTGYLEDLVKEKLGNSYQGINISYISNRKYSVTGTMYSLSQIEGKIDDDILLLEADLLYEPKVLQALTDSPDSDLMLVGPARGLGDEVFVQTDAAIRLVNVGKTIENKEESSGEFVGIAKLSLPFLKKLFEEAQKDYEQNEMKYYCEEVFLKLLKSHPMKCLIAGDLVWTDIDTEKELQFAKEVIFPKIYQSYDKKGLTD